MPERDSQAIVLSRQSILLVTAVSVGLLTLCYVLGVQVGKQSAALRNSAARGSGEELQELPASIEEQLKALQSTEPVQVEKAAPAEESPKAPEAVPAEPRPAATEAKPPAEEAKPVKKEDPKPATKENPKPAREDAKPAKEGPKPAGEEADKPEPKWTLQLVSTSDPKEAERISSRAKAAGYTTVTVKDKGAYKVRLAKPKARADIETARIKLKDTGFKPFAVKVE
ncbi:MAG TPA: SPOR domain-containing protein [Holophaga sp.]|nr:SPOR domain-containing protein [Holophaga sp.]